MIPPEPNDAMPEPDAPRIVRPRKPAEKYLPIIVVDRAGILIERTGETVDIDNLPAVIAAEPSSLIVCQGFGEHLERLCRVFAKHPDFQYRLSPRFKDTHIFNGKPGAKVQVEDTLVGLVGFQGKAKQRGHYHYPIDPVHFLRVSIDELDESPIGHMEKLYNFAERVRTFCLDHKLSLRASAGGIAAQLLKDPRFYPEARRKVPKRINAIARTRLPGNYYRLHAETDRRYSATYLDMANAHHFLARRITFPHADELFAYGHWAKESKRFWAPSGTRRYKALIDGSAHGLLHMRIRSPHIPFQHFPLPYIAAQGTHDVWVYTNELDTLREHRVQFLGIHAALVSTKVDEGLPAFAAWAMETVAARPDDKYWLKPTLHSAYGLLAARPSVMEFGYRNAKSGMDKLYPVGAALIPAKSKRLRGEMESSVVNVIQRGMIEAETRIEALRMARWLTGTPGQRTLVLSVYADSLFVICPALPFLPEPWRIKEHVTGLRFLSATQFVSTSLTRLPGLSKDLRKPLAGRDWHAPGETSDAAQTHHKRRAV